MITKQQKQIASTLKELYNDSKYDMLNMMKGAAKSVFRPMHPLDFKDSYLSISKEQGVGLVQLIKENHIKNVVEFGTSFGISTLFLAQGVLETGGSVITTELIESKAKQAIENFKKAGVNSHIEVRIGDALKTLKNHDNPIDLLLLDGWKDLYLPLFQMLEPNFHANTFIYIDNAEMTEVKAFLRTIGQNQKYQLQTKFGGKVVLATIKK
ncbi:class I SAM-dependent methyltransferase [Arenibacter algicola]|uniref:O-methyltransferase n=1 Tax=Arenibacter algicola TaxID=616991 RepID=UPI001C06E06B|nr:class I SAM-dependent methyltransferase [Arenibacter algicola]MBU2907505.1 class I SAM-dependent methyltransferase [Arenibacter algicola]